MAADLEQLERCLGVLGAVLPEVAPEGVEHAQGRLDVLTALLADRTDYARHASGVRARVSVKEEQDGPTLYARSYQDSGAGGVWEQEGREELRQLALAHGTFTLRLCGLGGEPSDSAPAWDVPARAWELSEATMTVRHVFTGESEGPVVGVLLELNGRPVRYGPLGSGVEMRPGRRLEVEAEIEF